MDNNSIAKTLIVIVLLCGVCSIIVSAMAIGLRPLQEANARAEISRGVLEVSGLYQPGVDEAELLKLAESRIVDLATGRFADAIAAEDFDLQSALTDPSLTRALSAQEDIASIGRLPRYIKVSLIRRDDRLLRIVLPVYGYGLWSTLYGFIALEPDANTVYGLKFYQHKETPGLGGRVDSPAWRAQWHGKRIYDDEGNLRLTVGKCGTMTNKTEEHQLDGLSGATLTACGVDNIIRFWFGKQAYGRFLELRPFDEGGGDGMG